MKYENKQPLSTYILGTRLCLPGILSSRTPLLRRFIALIWLANNAGNPLLVSSSRHAHIHVVGVQEMLQVEPVLGFVVSKGETEMGNWFVHGIRKLFSPEKQHRIFP